jgi:hypothetical protein
VTPTNKPTSTPPNTQRPVTGFQMMQAIVRNSISFWQRFFMNFFR